MVSISYCKHHFISLATFAWIQVLLPFVATWKRITGTCNPTASKHDHALPRPCLKNDVLPNSRYFSFLFLSLWQSSFYVSEDVNQSWTSFICMREFPVIIHLLLLWVILCCWICQRIRCFVFFAFFIQIDQITDLTLTLSLSFKVFIRYDNFYRLSQDRFKFMHQCNVATTEWPGHNSQRSN